MACLGFEVALGCSIVLSETNNELRTAVNTSEISLPKTEYTVFQSKHVRYKIGRSKIL